MFEKLKCERCGGEYRIKNVSENKGKHFCRDCISHCLVCGESLPHSNWYGSELSVTGAFLGPVAGSLHDMRKPAIGSGMCNKCYWKEQERVSTQPVQTSMPTPTRTFCHYCGAKNEDDAVFCKSCGKKIA